MIYGVATSKALKRDASSTHLCEVLCLTQRLQCHPRMPRNLGKVRSLLDASFHRVCPFLSRETLIPRPALVLTLRGIRPTSAVSFNYRDILSPGLALQTISRVQDFIQPFLNFPSPVQFDRSLKGRLDVHAL